MNPASKGRRGPGEVRLIAGAWKRSKLALLDRPGLRPTPDRVRETLFNWLGIDLTGWRCLDAFAGSGALGFEAASRGAAEVHLLELDKSLVEQLLQVQQRLGALAVRIVRGDALLLMAQMPAGSMDLVFLDPPFGSDLFEPALRAAQRLLAADGCVYLEAPQAWRAGALAGVGLQLQRHLKAGAVHAHLLVHGPAGAT